MKLTKVKQQLDSQLVKLWVQDQISKINYKKQMGLLLYISADAKIDILQDFYETFELDKVTFNVTCHEKV
jgi:exonuclease VII large subunit